MVAISLYRGELHRVPSVPRRWPIPPRAITLRQFRLLRDKRSKALARLFPDPIPSDPSAHAVDSAVTSGSQLTCGNGCVPTLYGNKPGLLGDEGTGSPNSTVRRPGDRGLTSSGGGTCVKEEHAGEEEEPTGLVSCSDEQPNSRQISPIGASEKVNEIVSEVDAKLQERLVEDNGRQELEKKLDMLSQKKHHLVKMLRHVLNAEEEMKRRTSMPPSAARPSVYLGTVDTASIAKHGTTKLSIDVNCGNLGEDTDFVDPNAPVRQVSPSPRATYAASGNAPSLSSVSGNMVTISPRFVPGQIGHASGLPSPSLSGAYFVASTPSPAASRAFSSVFKDANLTSP